MRRSSAGAPCLLRATIENLVQRCRIERPFYEASAEHLVEVGQRLLDLLRHVHDHDGDRLIARPEGRLPMDAAARTVALQAPVDGRAREVALVEALHQREVQRLALPGV